MTDKGIIVLMLFAYLMPHIAGVLLPGLVMFAAAWQDWRQLKIDNKHALVLIILFPLLAALSPATTFLPGVCAAFLMLVLGLMLYWVKLMGAGDVKLASAICLYIGMDHLSFFMLGTVLMGGVLAVIALIARNHPLTATEVPRDWIGRIRQGGSDIPYAVAMAIPVWFLLTQRLLAAYLHSITL